MLWKIIFMIFGSTQAYLIHPNEGPIERCANFLRTCNPYLDNPCCEENATCTAMFWYQIDTHECLRTVKLNTPCQSNLDCSGSLSVICDDTDKVCKCANNYKAINDHECAPLLDGYCHKNSDCHVPNSFCNNYKCKCRPSYVSQSNERCLLTPIGKACSNDSDCSKAGHAICSKDNGICECHEKYELVNEATCASFLDEYCQNNSDCWASNSLCINNRCGCEFAFVPVSHENCQFTPLGKPCEGGDQVCNSMFYGLEIMRKKYVCKTNKCTSLLGEFCIVNEDCASANWSCIANKCSYKDGSIPKFDLSFEPTPLNGFCKRNSDCDREKNLICSIDRKCICKRGYIEDDNESCAPILGQPCSETSQCKAGNSICVSGLCDCRAGYMKKSDIECVHLGHKTIN